MSALLSVPELKSLCEKYRIRPTKDRGQNFLIDGRVAHETIQAAGLQPDDEVIEVGPGFGALTFPLAGATRRVTAVEIEPPLVQWLRAETERRRIRNLEIIAGDFIRIIERSNQQTDKLINCQTVTQATIVASLPYSITSDFFSALLKDDCVPRRLVLIIQKEVAERICARPPHMSLLSVIVQWYGKVEFVRDIPRSAFWLQPAVESALVRIDTSDVQAAERRGNIKSETFFSFIKPAFRFPRRKIHTTLSLPHDNDIRVNPRLNPRVPARHSLLSGTLRSAEEYPHHQECNRSPRQALAGGSALREKRPGELTIGDWIALFRAKSNKM